MTLGQPLYAGGAAPRILLALQALLGAGAPEIEVGDEALFSIR